MSISPTDAYRSTKSTSQAISQNPNSHHGLHQTPVLLHSSTVPDTDTQIHGSVQISESFSDLAIGNPGTLAADVADSCGSSKKVSVLRTPDAKKSSNGQNHGASFQCYSAGRGGLSSQFRYGQFRSSQVNRRLSGGVGSSHTDQLATGSSSPHGNASQSSTRKNQTTSGNHLLNFYYDPISRPQSRIPPPRRQQKIKPYDKDLFLQANYQFLVLDTGNYTVELMNADKMLQWEDIVCVRYSTPHPVQCPICLESPLCPQITSCGHIYCFPCILRYLLMGVEDHKGDCWKKCPLCFMLLSSKDLYTVYIENVNQYHVGDHVYFTLLTRPKDSLIPSQKNQEGIETIPYGSDGPCDSFSKFTLTSDVELSVRQAKLELNDWLAKAESGQIEDMEQLPYVCAALDQLEQRKKSWIEHQAFSSSPPRKKHATHSNINVCKYISNKTESHACSSNASNDTADSEVCEPMHQISSIEFKDESNGLDDLSLEILDTDNCLVLPTDVPESFEGPGKVLFSYDEEKCLQSNSRVCKDAKESYTFYQAIDGQHLILHPLNMKCLLHHYGGYDLLPPRISGEILQLETVTQSEAMRRRYRFLSHFSLTTTFQLCEIDLSDILPPSSLSPFIDEIKKRRSQRKRVAKKEHEEKVKAEAAVMLSSPIPSEFSRSSHKDAIFSIDDFEALGSCTVSSTSPPVIGERKLFSDVTRLGFASAHDSPSLKDEESADASNNMEGTGPRSTSTLSFANIISTAESVSGSPEGPRNNDFRKKGKKPNRVLLSTAGGRRY